jgi:hypothetical protein
MDVPYRNDVEHVAEALGRSIFTEGLSEAVKVQLARIEGRNPFGPISPGK